MKVKGIEANKAIYKAFYKVAKELYESGKYRPQQPKTGHKSAKPAC